MYICLCMGVSDCEIREAIAGGARSVPEVMQCTGAGTRCGSCRPTIATLVSTSAAPEADRTSRRSLDLVRTPTAA